MTKAGRISAQDSLSKVTGDKNIIKRTHETSRPNFHWCDLKKKMYRTQRHKFPKTHWKRNTNISPPPSQTTPGTTLNTCLSSSSRKETLRYTPALGDSRGRPRTQRPPIQPTSNLFSQPKTTQHPTYHIPLTFQSFFLTSWPTTSWNCWRHEIQTKPLKLTKSLPSPQASCL